MNKQVMDIRRGQVWWWTCPHHSRSHIQQGTRPVVIVSNDVCNQASAVVTVVPLTTSVKRPFPQQVPVIHDGGVSIALADQLTSIPVAELDRYLCTLREFQMDQIEKAIAIQLGLIDVASRPYAPFPKQPKDE